MPGTAQRSRMVCSLSPGCLPFASCFPRFPSLLCGSFLECSAQNSWLWDGFGKSTGNWSLSASSLHHLPHPERQPCSHIYAGPQWTTGRKCLGSGYHGDRSCCLDHSGLPAACRSLQAWQPGTPQASSQAECSWGCPHRSP